MRCGMFSLLTALVTLFCAVVVTNAYPASLTDDLDDDLQLSSDTDQIYDQYTRIRRTSSDQRIAELEALATLVGGRGYVGHGRIDPFLYGKRKRDHDLVTWPDMVRYPHPFQAEDETERESVLEPTQYPAERHRKLLHLIGILHGDDDMSAIVSAREPQ